MSGVITWADFGRAGIRVGSVADAKTHPEAQKPSIQLWTDLALCSAS